MSSVIAAEIVCLNPESGVEKQQHNPQDRENYAIYVMEMQSLQMYCWFLYSYHNSTTEMNADKVQT